MIILAELTPLDPVGGSRVTLTASSAQDRTVTALNSVRWFPAIVDPLPSLTMPLFNGDFEQTADVAPGSANLTVQVDTLASLDANVRRFNWQGAGVKLYAGNSGQAWPWTQVFEGKVSKFGAKANSVSLTCEVNQEPFQKNVLTSAYAGTTGAEGDANLKNKVKPLLLGRCTNVEPVLINAVDNVYQLSAYGPISAITTLYERGAASLGTSIGDYASYALLVAATIPAGRYGTCLASGLFRLGAPAYGVITADVDGDKPSGTWLSKTGEIINRIATLAGVSGGSIDSSSLTALDSAISTLTSGGGIIGAYLTEQVSVLELAKQLAQPCNAVAGISFLGKLFVARVKIGTPTVTLDAQGRRLPAVISASEESVSPPFKRLEMGAQRSWRVHSYDEIATYAPIVQMGAYAGGTTYREGNIVQDQGASWYYINSTPTAGNAPPTLPTTSNSYWTQFVAPGAAGSTGATGAAGTNAKLLYLISDRQTVNVDAAGSPSPSTQTTTFTVNEQSLSSTTVTVSMTKADGTTINANTYLTGSGTVTPVSNNFTMTGTSITMTAANFNTARAATTGVIVTVSHADGVSDKVGIVIAQAGAAGSNGSNGVDAKTVYVSSTYQTINYDAAGALSPSGAAQNNTFTATKQNTSNAVTWTLADNKGNSLTAGTYLSATTGDTVTMTAANFGAALAVNGATGVVVTGTVTADSISDKISVGKVQAGSNGSNGSNGTNGANGSDGISADLTLAFIGIACTANGTEKSGEVARITGDFQLRLGGTLITSGVTYSVNSQSPAGGLTGLAFSGATFGSVTGVTADSVTATLRATYGGINYDRPLIVTKLKDGTGGNSFTAPITALTTSASFTTCATADIIIPNGSGLSVNARAVYTASGGSGTYGPQMKITYENITDSGAEVDFTGSTVTGDEATTSEPASVRSGPISITNSTGHSVTYRVRAKVLRNSGTGSAVSVSGSLAGSQV